MKLVVGSIWLSLAAAGPVPALDHDVFGPDRSKDIVIDFNMIEHDVVRKPVPAFRHHALAQTAGPADPAKAAPPTVGQAAWAALLGNTISGSTPDGPYADFFTPDGTAIHLDAEGREAGTWTFGETGVCFSFPTDPDEHAECRRIEIQGTHGAFIDNDGSRYPFDILPGNPKNL